MHCIVLTGLACSIHATWESLTGTEVPIVVFSAVLCDLHDWLLGALQDGGSDRGRLGEHSPGNRHGAVAAGAFP